jgi:histidinol-phosphate aminotransferase
VAGSAGYANVMTFRLTKLAERLPSSVPFVGPETQERQSGRPFAARLGANENVFGPSPKAAAALQDAGMWMYGDPESHDLRKALAEFHGVTPDHIVVGEGIDGLLGYVVRLFVAEGDPVVTSDGAYPTFNYHVAGFGGVLHKVPYRDDHEDPKALFDAAGQVGAKLVYLANPDNPMGTWHSGTALAEALDQLPQETLLVLDEAYVETAPSGTALEISADDPRVLRMRTFSKAYGLAGARVGYAIGHPDLISAFHKVRNHFGVSRTAQVAALAALEDQAYLQKVLTQIETARSGIGEIVKASGLVPLPSATNFVTIDCGKDAAFAQRVLAELVARGVFVRAPFAAPGNRCIRVSCAPAEYLDVFAKVLPDALRAANI